MLPVLSVLPSSLSFSNTNYNYTNTNTNVSSHLCCNCSIDLALMAKNINSKLSVGTPHKKGENDLSKQRHEKI